MRSISGVLRQITGFSGREEKDERAFSINDGTNEDVDLYLNIMLLSPVTDLRLISHPASRPL